MGLGKQTREFSYVSSVYFNEWVTEPQLRLPWQALISACRVIRGFGSHCSKNHKLTLVGSSLLSWI